jgi:hypothetical protein
MVGAIARPDSRPEDAMQTHEIRRHADGSLDVDFYRRRAARLRRQELHDTLRAKAVPLTRVVVAATILAVTVSLMPAADGTGWNGERTSQNAGVALPRPAAPGKS